jgi:hypothetical protein
LKQFISTEEACELIGIHRQVFNKIAKKNKKAPAFIAEGDTYWPIEFVEPMIIKNGQKRSRILSLMTEREVFLRLQVSGESIRKYIRVGKLKAIICGDKYYFDPREVERYIESVKRPCRVIKSNIDNKTPNELDNIENCGTILRDPQTNNDNELNNLVDYDDRIEIRFIGGI